MSRKKLVSILIVLILAVSFSALVYRNITLSREMREPSKKLFSEIERENARIEKLYSAVAGINSDVNEVRKKLFLPEKVYPLQETKPKTTVSEERRSKDLPFFLAADRLRSFNRRLDNIKKLGAFVSSPESAALFVRYGLTPAKYEGKGFYLKKNNRIYYTLSITRDDPFTVTLTSAAGTRNKELMPGSSAAQQTLRTFMEQTFSDITSFYSKQKALLRAYNTVAKNRKFLSIVKKYHLRVSSQSTSSRKNQRTRISTEDNRQVLVYGLNTGKGVLFIGDKTYPDFAPFMKALLAGLETADKRTADVITVDTAKKRIEAIASDKIFTGYLKERGLRLSATERQDNDYFYYDFLNSENVRQGSLGVQKHIGTIYLFDPEDVVITSLKSLEYASSPPQQSSFVIPENTASFSKDALSTASETLILVGSHEQNADTIILANLDKSKNRILLFSIPRDLYYKNRKINDYYRTYGGKKFSEIVADITGLTIAGYIGIDMYAFIDVINILGGIDVNLKSDLTDPTYKVRDNGIWTTLHYSKGFHHLNGIEALRVARSRHTSSDFGRSDRQQLILQGVKDKLNSLNVSDMNKVYSIFKTIDEYLDTDLSPMEMISLFLSYRNAALEKKDGLSTFNVLYNTYSNIYALKDKSKQYESGFYRGAWILLPRNNDWNVIKWYIDKIIKE